MCVNIKNQTQDDRSSEFQCVAPRLTEIRQRSAEVLMTLLTVQLRALAWGFLSSSHHHATSGRTESRNRRFYTKNLTLPCLKPLMWTGWISLIIPGAFIMWLHCSTIDPLGLSTSQLKLTQKQYFWHFTPVQIAQPEAYNWQSTDQKFPEEYQGTYQQCQGHSSSQGRACYQ